MKSPLKILTTAAVAGALVATAVAGPASAADVPVQPVISVPVAPVTVTAYTENAPVVVNTSAGPSTEMTAVVTANGATYSSSTLSQDDAGNATVDLVAAVSRGAFGYGEVPAGTYTVSIVSAAYTKYGYPDNTVYAPAQSAPITLVVNKLTTVIKGFSTKTKKIKRGAHLRGDTYTVTNPGRPGTALLEHKMKGGKWKVVLKEQVYGFDSLPKKDGYSRSQAIKSGGSAYKRGTHYFRYLVKGTAFTTGATTKAFKFVVK